MKKTIIIILLTATIYFAQTKADSTEYIQLLQRAEETKKAIINLQSKLYEEEKQLEALYKDFILYNNLANSKKELIEIKKTKK